MPVPHEMAGMTFERLKVIRLLGVDRFKKRVWECRCDCGKITTGTTQAIISGGKRSCGCIQKEIARETMKAVRDPGIIHGLSRTREYDAYRNMMNRCENPKCPEYRNYGSRGIKVCERWRESFEAFLEDMGPKPPGTSLDRSDNDGDYEPGNCSWQTPEHQSNNKRNNVRITRDGMTLTVAQWAKILSRSNGIHPHTIEQRLRSGWDFERAESEPLRVTRRTRA